MQITSEGRKYLGAALGSSRYTEKYVTEWVEEWNEYIRKLSAIATTQPHAAYAALTHGVASLWTYLLCTVPDISNLLQPLEDTINLQFISALTGRVNISEQERMLFVLPTRLGG